MRLISSGICRSRLLKPHLPVAAPQAGLEVHDRYPQLGADHRAGGGGVDVADHDDPIRAVLHADLLVGDHYAAGLFGMGAAADAQVEIGLGDAEVFEDRVRHVAVIVLTRVHENGLRPVGGFQRVIERRHLHEVGAGGGNEVDGLWGHSRIIRDDLESVKTDRPVYCGPQFSAGRSELLVRHITVHSGNYL
jgi:hypothetical protein